MIEFNIEARGTKVVIDFSKFTSESVGWPNQITRGVIVQNSTQGIYKAVIPSFTHGTIVKKFAWLKCIQS